MVVEKCAKALVYNQQPGRVWGRVGDKELRLTVWDGIVCVCMSTPPLYSVVS